MHSRTREKDQMSTTSGVRMRRAAEPTAELSPGARIGLPVLGVAVVIGLWWLLILIFEIKPILLPSPLDIVDAFGRQPRYLVEETWVTMVEVLTGFGIAATGGLVLAVVLAASRVLERATLPMLVGLNSVPKVAIIPMLVVWLGFGMTPKIVLVILICFFPIVVSAMSGLASTPVELGELARSLSASWWQTYVKVRLPWALPQIFVGLKLAISLAVIGAVVAEIANPSRGLGSVIALSGGSVDTPLAFAAIVLLAVLSVALFYLVSALERLLLPWAREIAG